MNKICTSIEQSKKLIELGIDINTADMHHVLIDSDKEIYDIGLGNYIGILPHYPAWSLTALFEILPNDEVTSTTVTRGGWDIKFEKYFDIWFAEYETEKHNNDFSLSANNPLDAAFEMIVWLKENKKL